MLTVLIAAATLAACVGVRYYLERIDCRERAWAGGRIRLGTLWNEGAAFGLPLGRKILLAASATALVVLWLFRRRSPLAAGLILGGGISNLLERVRFGKVYDYIRFPKAPGRLKRYVYNLADAAIFLGGIVLILSKDRRP